jgi:hypothetical protein
MSAPAAEGGQDYDDILGFPGDGFKDKDDANPAEAREPAVDGGDTQMNEEAAGSCQSFVRAFFARVYRLFYSPCTRSLLF